MGWISRLREAHGVETPISRAENQINSLRPLFDLQRDIISASWQCAEEIKASLSKFPLTKYGTPSEQKKFEIFCELLFFFVHFTSRQAYGRLPRATANNLVQTIGEFILSSVVDGWPDELKTRVSSELYANLNQAEQEYATCKQLSEPILPAGLVRTRLDDSAILSRLAVHVLAKAREEQEIDPTQIDTETAVLADMLQAVVTAKLVDGEGRPRNSEAIPEISYGTMSELGVRVSKASAVLEAYEHAKGSLRQAQREVLLKGVLRPSDLQQPWSEIEAEGRRLMAILKTTSERIGGPCFSCNDKGEVFVHPALARELNKAGNEGLRENLLQMGRIGAAHKRHKAAATSG